MINGAPKPFQWSDLDDALLAHYSACFMYHAKQRLDTIRFAIILFSAMVSLLIALALPSDDSSRDPDFMNSIGLLGSLFAFAVIVLFARLDIRNRLLVEINENCLTAFHQKWGSERGVIYANNNDELFNTIIVSGDKRVFFTSYGTVVPILYLFILIFLSGFAVYFSCLVPSPFFSEASTLFFGWMIFSVIMFVLSFIACFFGVLFAKSTPPKPELPPTGKGSSSS